MASHSSQNLIEQNILKNMPFKKKKKKKKKKERKEGKEITSLKTGEWKS